jgi:hypothetical protein
MATGPGGVAAAVSSTRQTKTAARSSVELSSRRRAALAASKGERCNACGARQA